MTLPAAHPHGLVLLAHGSRDPMWRTPIEAIARQAGQLDAQRLIRCAYLELSSPDLMACVRELAALGVRQIKVVPLFLGIGKHAREDMPKLVAKLRVEFPKINFTLAPAIGENERMITLIAQISLAE